MSAFFTALLLLAVATITAIVFDAFKLADYPLWLRILGIIWLLLGLVISASILLIKPKPKDVQATQTAVTHGNASPLYQSAGPMTVNNYSGLSTEEKQLMEAFLKRLNSPDDPEDKPYPGLSFFFVLSIHEQTEKRRKFIFDFGTSKDRSRLSAYLTEDNALAFRVIDQTGETNTIRVPRSEIEMKTMSFWLFEIGKFDNRSFIRISRDGKRLQSAIVNYPIDERSFSVGSFAAFSDMDGQNNGAGNSGSSGIYGQTLTGAQQRELVRGVMKR